MRLAFMIDIHRPPRDVFALVGNLEQLMESAAL